MEQSKTLINQAKQGQQSAFSALLEFHWDYVYNYLYNQTKSTYISEEISIQTFARAFDKISTYNDDFSFKTWLITICKRILIDRKRKKEIETTKINTKTNTIKSEEINVEDSLIQAQNVNQIQSAVNTLKAADAKILYKHLFEEKSHKEIASEIGESTNFTKVKILRAKKKLAQKIKPNH